VYGILLIVRRGALTSDALRGQIGAAQRIMRIRDPFFRSMRIPERNGVITIGIF
jgi:hypothetical protein